MTPSTPSRRPKRLPFILLAPRLPAKATNPARPPAPAPLVPPAPPAEALRVGEYEIGPGFCPRLLGHPDIRYGY